MQISTQEYLYLIQQINLLKKQKNINNQQNILLSNQIIKQRERNNHLEKQIKQFKQMSNQKQQEMKQHINNQTNKILSNMFTIHEQQNKFVREEFQKMKAGGAIKRMQQLQKQLIQNRRKVLQSFKYHQFHQNVKVIYQNRNKKKQEPTMRELLKWIREKKTKDGKQNMDITNLGLNTLQQSTCYSKPPKKSKKSIQTKGESQKDQFEIKQFQTIPQERSFKKVYPTDSQILFEKKIHQKDYSSRVDFKL